VADRGLNSLSVLSYLAVAGHVSGDSKYSEAALGLIRNHGYAQNLMVPKIHGGPGGGNQSDDEMAFMGFYSLIKYEKDPALKGQFASSLRSHWNIKEPEMNPFFNFVCSAICTDVTFADPWGTHDLTPEGDWLEDSEGTLHPFSAVPFQLAPHQQQAQRHRSAQTFPARRYGERSGPSAQWQGRSRG